MEISLTKNKIAIVDADDYEMLTSMGKWSFNGHGYAIRNGYRYQIGKAHMFMHRIVNKTPDGYYTDHINGNTLDNRKSNLRTVTHSQNMMNRTGHRDKSFNGYSKTRSGKYTVSFCNKKIGTFETEELAYQIYTMLLSGELPPERIITQKGYELKRGKYQVRIKNEDSRVTLGVFDTPEEAQHVYITVKEQLGVF